MKILHINEYYGTLGGAESYLTAICEALAPLGWEAVVVASNAPNPADTGAPRTLRLEPSFGLRSTRRAAAALERILDVERPDVAHLHNIQYFLGPPLMRMLQQRVPVVQTVHDARAFCPRWISKVIPLAPALCNYPMGSHCFRHGCFPFHREMTDAFQNLQKFFLVGWQMARMRTLDRIIVSSRYMREQLMLNGFPPDRVVTLPMFPSLSYVSPQLGRRRRCIVFAGRIDESKGIRQFLESLTRLPPGDWSAQVAGDGPFLAEARAIAASAGLADRVAFVGRLKNQELAEWLASAYVLVMPTLVPESFGLVGLEALACATPVVAFDSGGISQWLKDGHTGFLVPWGDVEALTGRLAQLLADENLAEKLGRHGREWARKFDRARHVGQLCEIYREVAARRCGTAPVT